MQCPNCQAIIDCLFVTSYCTNTYTPETESYDNTEIGDPCYVWCPECSEIITHDETDPEKVAAMIEVPA